MTKTVLIDGMKGLGDNIYQRPFVRAVAERHPGGVWLSTPWPELYADLDVRFVRTGTSLRTQRLNERRQPEGVYRRPPGRFDHVVRVGYGTVSLRKGSIVQAMEAQLPLRGAPFRFDLPDLGPGPVQPIRRRPLAVVRPVTVRQEWRNEARNPAPEHVAFVAGELMKTHHVIVVAHLEAGAEWLIGELPPHHEAFVAGEFDVRQLLALVRDADVVVGGVGWIVPAAIALRRSAFIVQGGHGAHNSPEVITDPRMDLSRIAWATPDPYCRCEDMRHQCSKAIPHLPEAWARFAATLSASRPRRRRLAAA